MACSIQRNLEGTFGSQRITIRRQTSIPLPTGLVCTMSSASPSVSRLNGGVRGTGVGDVFRRVVARTIVKQFRVQGEAATSPFQFALTTRAGCECVSHLVRSATDMDERTTIVSVDGIGAYDSISRTCMLASLHRMVDGDQMIPFVRLFYGSPSVYLWKDDAGDTHEIVQGEGREQGDPLMPLLFSLGQHSAMLGINAGLSEGESLFAFLD